MGLWVLWVFTPSWVFPSGRRIAPSWVLVFPSGRRIAPSWVFTVADNGTGKLVESQTGAAAASATKSCFYAKNGHPVLHLTLNPLYIPWMRDPKGAVGIYRISLYDKDGRNPVQLTSGDLREGKTVSFALPPMTELAGRAIYIVGVITFLSGEWANVGWKLDLADSQPDGSKLVIDGSQKEAATKILPDEVATPKAVYRFCASE